MSVGTCKGCGRLLELVRGRYCSDSCYFDHYERKNSLVGRTAGQAARKRVSAYFKLEWRHRVLTGDGNDWNLDLKNLIVQDEKGRTVWKGKDVVKGSLAKNLT